jgi:hypothetical protein
MCISIPPDPNGEWWELFDETHRLPYYYNTKTGVTDWVRPHQGTIIPLRALQALPQGKRMSVAIADRASKVINMDDFEAVEKARMQQEQNSQRSAGSTTKGPVYNAQQQQQHNSRHNSMERQYASGQGRIDSMERQRQQQMAPQIREPTPDTQPRNPVQMRPGYGDARGNQHGQLVVNGHKGMSRSLSDFEANYDSHSPSPSLHKATSALDLSGTSSVPLGDGPRSAVPTSAMLQHSDSKRQRRASLPSEPTDSKQHAIDVFARKYFATHKKGLFRKKVRIEELIEFTTEAISLPLLVLNKNVHKDALKIFKLVQRIMGDRRRDKGTTDMDDMLFIVERGIQSADLRDEIFVQICKQVTKNPNQQNVFKGWELMAVMLVAFPPSKNFEEYLKAFIRTRARQRDPGNERTTALGKHCLLKLERISKLGPKGKCLTPAEIDRAKEAAFKPSPFGETLEFVMEMQRESYGRLPVPRIMVFLTREILRLNGQQCEGIFRVPGDAEAVTALRVSIENNRYELTDVYDPNVPASLLKFWLRDLADPLIPMQLYDLCLENSGDIHAILSQVILKLPPVNRRVVDYMIGFLKVFAQEQSARVTKMHVDNIAMVFAPNFLRCPSSSLTQVFENTKHEQEFVKSLILGLQVPSPPPAYDI